MGKLILLGTGGSTGTPMIGCHCEVCRSQDPRDQRLRPSALLIVEGKQILIDPGPDTREFCLRYSIEDLDAVMITHTHYDHLAGIDELRVFNIRHKRRLPCLLSKSSYQDLSQRMSHLISGEEEGKSLAAKFDFVVIPHDVYQGVFCDVAYKTVTYIQGGMKVSGFVFGNLAYLTDIKYFEESIFQELVGVETLVISAQRQIASPVHFTIEEALAFGAKMQVKKIILTHISHEISHQITESKLPNHVELGFDGKEVLFS